MKQVARRHGYLVELHVPAAAAEHASPAAGTCTSRCSIANPARTCSSRSDKAELLSPLGTHYLAGLLAHARAAAAFTTPTVNGYKRYHGVNSMAPIQAIWAQGQSRRDGPRAGRAGRSGDASGEPRRRAAGQSLSLHGLADLCGPRWHRAQARCPGRPPIRPTKFQPSRCRSRSPRRWRRSTTTTVSARASAASSSIIYLRIKDAEIARFDAETTAAGNHGRCHRLGAQRIFRFSSP